MSCICDNAIRKAPPRSTQCYCFYKSISTSNAVTHHPVITQRPLGGALNIKNTFSPGSNLLRQWPTPRSTTPYSAAHMANCINTAHTHTNTLFTAAYDGFWPHRKYTHLFVRVMLQIYTRYIIMLCFLYNNILNVLWSSAHAVIPPI